MKPMHGHFHHTHVGEPSVWQGRLARRAAAAAVAVALALAGLKLYGWVVTDSLSLFSSLVDSLLDTVVSGINLIAVHYALKPADDDHRFGHTAIEDIAGLAQAVFISGSALFILIEATSRFLSPHPMLDTDAGIEIMAVSMAATIGLVAYQHYTVRRTRSLVIKADALHYLSDVLSNAAVLASFYLYRKLGWDWVDPLLALVIAGFILQGAWKIGLRAFHHLMDRELPDADKNKLLEILARQPDIRGYHALRTRGSGRKRFIEMHLEIDGALSLTQAHAIVDRIEKEILRSIEEAEVIIHYDPR